MEDVLGVDEFDAFTDLPNKDGAGPLAQHKVVVNDTLEQFTSVHSGKTNQLVGGGGS